MENKQINEVLQIEGMFCTSCERRIESAVSQLAGVEKVKAVFSKSQVYVTYTAGVIGLQKIIDAIEQEHYSVVEKNPETATGKDQNHSQGKLRIHQLIGIGIILFAVYLIIKNTVGFNLIPQIDPSMGYGILFVVGLLTSLHCIAMCGGINIAQCVSRNTGDAAEAGVWAKLKPSLLYNGGRVIAYTIVGGIVGALGSVVSFSGTAKGVVAVVAGLMMVIMGLNMLNIFPWLRRITPSMTRFFGNKIHNNQGQYGPLYVGLLNGLMPCGPLQAMQLYALGTGSAVTGALSMLVFSLGTVPLMFGLGAISSILSSKFTHRMLKASAIMVIVLGVVMFNRGLSLSGYIIGLPSSVSSVARVEDNVQYVGTVLTDGYYSPIVVQKGVPVKWVIKATADDLNGCNNPVTIPRYNLAKELVPGANLIQFTPEESGTIVYTCWMGMISSYIKVVDDISAYSGEAQD